MHRFRGAGGMPTQLKLIDMVLIVVSCGLWAVLWRLLVFPRKEKARIATIEPLRAEARKMVKPTCDDPAGLHSSSKGDLHVFYVPTAAWVQALTAANGLK